MSLPDLSLNFIINLVAGVVGILIVLGIERQRRPVLFMEAGEPGWLSDDDPLGRKACKWLHVQVHNKNMPRWLAWVYNREPAMDCHAWITFYHLDGHRLFAREMNARWTETPEPELVVLQAASGQAMRLMNVQDAVGIPPGEYANVDIAFRAKDEDASFGWNNESYLHHWRHPSWRLDKGRYIVRVRVKTGGREFSDAFLLINDVPYEHFRLEPLDKGQKAHLK